MAHDTTAHEMSATHDTISATHGTMTHESWYEHLLKAYTLGIWTEWLIYTAYARVLEDLPPRVLLTHRIRKDLAGSIASICLVYLCTKQLWHAGRNPWQPCDLARTAGHRQVRTTSVASLITTFPWPVTDKVDQWRAKQEKRALKVCVHVLLYV